MSNMNNMSKNTNKYIKLHTYEGKLIYNDNAEYELLSPISKSTINLSELLNTICYSYNNNVEIRILKGCKILFNESGRLLNNINKENGLLSYHVNSEDFESVLFYNTDEYLDIEINSGFLDDLDRQKIENSESRQGDYIIDVRTK